MSRGIGPALVARANQRRVGLSAGVGVEARGGVWRSEAAVGLGEVDGA